ncbi:MAG: XRE family transcriptional regulator [Chloroflexi bacterium]|nr:XRE family transcriptional regulator [Chloroflexota bacterium]
MIGDRLKLARSASGLSLRELSDRIHNRVSAQAIGKYERNESMPSSGVLIALADALWISVNYLTGNPSISLQSVEFRAKGIASKKEEDRIKATVLHKLERYLTIERILNLPSIHWQEPMSAPYPVTHDLLEVDRAASRLRNDWGLGNNPIPDMAELMEDRGVKVLFCELSGVDGLTAQVLGEGLQEAHVIVVNLDHTRDRQRFTIAHEIGHMVLDVTPGIDKEKAAYRFAGAFLMPEEVLWAKIGKHRSAIDWKELLALKLVFGISVQAITYRCKDLGIISQALMGRLFDIFEENGWRSPPYREPLDILDSPFGRFERLCLRALAERAISESKASELLERAVSDLDALWEGELTQ